MGTQATDLTQLREQVEALSRIVHGNGSTGLKTDVAVLSERTEVMLQELRELREMERKSSRHIAYAIGGLYLLSALIGVVIKFWKP